MDKVSIIVPIYNAEKHIDDCLKSIVSQTYPNIEILLIDDGSTDRSAEICDRYALNDKRIFVHHISNGGVANARNLGLSEATGKYIVFADSDDIYMEAFVAKSLASIKDVEYVSWAFETFNSNGLISKIDYLEDYDETISIEEYLKKMIQYQAGAYWGANWCKFYRKSIIDKENIRFESDVLFAEDLRFNLEYLAYVSRISVIHENGYLYRIDTEGSLSKKQRDINAYWKEYYELYERYMFLYRIHNLDDLCKDGLNLFLIRAFVSVLREAATSNRFSTINLIKLSFVIQNNTSINKIAKQIKITKCKDAFFAKLIQYNVGWLIGLYYKNRG